MDSMDTRTQAGSAGPASKPDGQQLTAEDRRRIEQGQQIIKSNMPGVYGHICKAAAADKRIWGLVRMGLAGRPNCFWAMEGQQLAGTPFVAWASLDAPAKLLQQMARPAFVCLLGPLPQEA